MILGLIYVHEMRKFATTTVETVKFTTVEIVSVIDVILSSPEIQTAIVVVTCYFVFVMAKEFLKIICKVAAVALFFMYPAEAFTLLAVMTLFDYTMRKK